MNSPVLLALVAAIIYGIGSPAMKIGLDHGVSPNAIMIAYGIGVLIVSSIWWKFGGAQIVLGTDNLGTIMMVTTGLTFAIAFVCVLRAFVLPTGSITVIMTLVASYPVLSSVIEILFMDAKVRPTQALAGCVLVITGGILVATSTTASE